MVLICIALGLWALAATLMLFVRNPLPFPDRGHRTFGVPDTNAQKAVVSALSQFGLPLRFRFKSGPLDQALLWDNTTVIHYLDRQFGHSGTAISVAVPNPEAAAAKATAILRGSGFSVERVQGADAGLAPNHLVVLTSDAFLGWVLVFRKHILKMPRPHIVSLD